MHYIEELLSTSIKWQATAVAIIEAAAAAIAVEADEY